RQAGVPDGAAAGALGTIRNCGLAGGAAWPSLRCWTSCSMGTESTGAFTGTGPVISIPGWYMPISEFFVRKGDGRLSDGTGWPAGTGRTTSGVTMTSSSELLRFTARLVNSLPSSGVVGIGREAGRG